LTLQTINRDPGRQSDVGRLNRSDAIEQASYAVTQMKRVVG
jgi:hypothetical protein